MHEKFNCPKGEAWSDWLTGPFVSYSGSGYDKIIEPLSPCDKTMTKNTVRSQSTNAEEPIITMKPVTPADTTSSPIVIALSATLVGVVGIGAGVLAAYLYKYCKSPPAQDNAPPPPPSQAQLQGRNPHGGQRENLMDPYAVPARNSLPLHNKFVRSKNCVVYEAKVKHIHNYYPPIDPTQAAEGANAHLAHNEPPRRAGDGHHHDGRAERTNSRGES